MLIIGAGYHSDSLRKEYQRTCYAACRKAAESLSQGGNAVDAVEKAIIGITDKTIKNINITNYAFVN